MKIKSIHTLLAGGVAGAALLLGATSAQAVDFTFGDVAVKLDTTVSLGVGVRTSAADCQKVGLANGGCLIPGPAGAKAVPTGSANTTGYDFGTSSDNSNILNKQWEPFSEVAKVVPELSITWQNYGAFFRGQAYYDYWAQKQLGSHSDSRFVNQPIDYNTGNATDFNRAGYGAKLLDAFVYGKWDIGASSLNVRLGNQVVNWGESLFIQGGINAFQPIDANAIVKPGSELKEAYTPDPLIDVQVSLPGNFAVEGFYKFAWNRTTLPVAGTFFGNYSAADAIGPGQAFLPFAGDYAQDVAAFGSAGAAATAGVLVRRQQDNTPSNQGQFGAKLGYYADWLNDGTDMGLSFTHFHGPLPYLDFTVAAADSTNVSSVVASGLVNPGAANFGSFATYLATNGAQNQNGTQYATVLGTACALNAGVCLAPINATTSLTPALLSTANRMRYLTNYASGINSIGYSFNTVLSNVLNGTAFSGEFSFTPKNPLQKDVYAGILANNLAIYTGAGTLITQGNPINTNFGSIITPWKERQTLNSQFGFISTLPNTFPGVNLIGSDLVVLVTNVGFQWIPNLAWNDYLSGSHSTANSANGLVDAVFAGAKCLGNPAGIGNPFATCPGAGKYYADSFSWGYRMALSADYNNALGTAWTLTPSIVWSHDVKGISAGPIGPGFVEGIKKIKLGVGGRYQSWRVNLDWTSSFGNKYLNDNIDKDYATATVSYAF